MVDLSMSFSEEQKKEIDDFEDNLKMIKEKCGISRDTMLQDDDILKRKKQVILLLDVMELVDTLVSETDWCFCEAYYNDISQKLSKIKESLLEVDSSKLTEIYEAVIKFIDKAYVP